MKHTITTTTSSGKSTYEVEGDEFLDLLAKIGEDMEYTADEAIKDNAAPEDVAFLLCDIVNGAFFDRADQLHKAQTKTS